MKKIITILLIGFLIINGYGAYGSYVEKSFIQQNFNNEEYDMIIIAPEIFSDSIQNLIDHKNSVGIQTFLKTTEDIYDEYEGRDEAEQIKYFIYESALNYNISYVLLIGDVDTTPIRKTEVNHIWPAGDLTQVDDIITDLYYADIFDAEGSFSSWDSNNDDVFSEFYLYNLNEIEVVDEVDLYPDVGVGRIPCSNNDELDIVINKIISYETQSFGPWFQRAILAGEDGFPEPGYQCEMVTERVGEILTDFTLVKLYESLNNLKIRNINREINDGAGFFVFLAHGSHMAIYNYHKFLINFLRNMNKLPIIVLGGCLSAQIDVSLHELLKDFGLLRFDSFLQLLNINTKKLQTCISWEFLKQENGGSIATFGDTRKGQLVRDDPLSGFGGLFLIKLFECYEPGILLSDMHNNAINSFIEESWKNHVTLQMVILLGDPSLKIGGYN